MIRPVRMSDAQSIADIYNYYIENTAVSFEEAAVSIDEMRKRIFETVVKYPWFVSTEAGRITGFAFASKWKGRGAYRNTVETAIYLDKDSLHGGTGTAMYKVLLTKLRQRGFHTAVGGIALPNPASVSFHEKLGFEKIAHFKEIGYKFEKWIDVGYWQLILNTSEISTE